MAAKVTFLDIETAPTLGWVWDMYDTNVIAVEQNWFMLSYSHGDLDEDAIHCSRLCDYPLYKVDKKDDRELVEDLWKVFDDADIIVAHNGDAFDIKKSNARFIAHGLPPPSPYKTIDTLKIARKHFKFESNKLASLGAFLGLGVKVPHTGFDLWKGCMNGDKKSWNLMGEYNVQDTALLKAVYFQLRRWATNLPNLALYSDGANADLCPACGSSHVQRRGLSYARTQKRQRFQCVDCGSWFQGGLVKDK
jgi:DNA polymerase elongation subunit (family B)